jgi:hypothetical protein
LVKDLLYGLIVGGKFGDNVLGKKRLFDVGFFGFANYKPYSGKCADTSVKFVKENCNGGFERESQEFLVD